MSIKGGDPGFVRVVADDVIEWPDYDGNSMYRSLGNIAASPPVGLLFVAFDGGDRLRINGRATLLFDAKARAGLPGAKLVVRVTATDIYSNCPRYIPKLDLVAPSPYVPRSGIDTPEPAWKSRDYARDVLHASDRDG